MAKKKFQTSLEILEKLVSFKTVSKDSNLELIEFVEEYFKSHGLESYRVYDKTGEKAAIYTHIGPKNKGGIILSGHSDVVPVEGQEWDTNPFKLTEKIYRPVFILFTLTPPQILYNEKSFFQKKI